MAKEKRTLEDFRPLWPAEQLILDCLDDPHVTQIGDGALPPADAPRDRQVRASFLRWCALGAGDGHRLHETGLRIAGALVVSDGEADPFLGPESTPGLDLEGCRIEGDLGLFDCRFADPPLLRSAHLRNLFLNDGALPGLKADGLTTEGGVFLRGATVEGEIRLPGARIGGYLDCEGGTFRNPEGMALAADGLTTEGDIALSGATAEGEVRLLGARISGNLDCDGGTFRNEGGKALSADGLTTEGDIALSGATAEGEVRFLGARISGNLDCDGGTFRNEGGKALSADRLTTEGGVFLRGATTEGAVRLLGARIGGNLECGGGTFRNEGGKALNADRLTTEGGVFLRGATTEGAVCLPVARIGGNLECDGGTFRNPEGWALIADGAAVTGALFWRGGARAVGALGLNAASFGSINDDPSCWPDRLHLNRCQYGAFTGLGISAEARIDWLSRQNPADYGKDFWPQPWEQCARVLREMGHAEDARAVLIDKERRQREDRRRRLAIRLEAARMRLRLADADADARDALVHEINARIDYLWKASNRDGRLYREKVSAARSLKDRARSQTTPDGDPGAAPFRAEARAKLGLDRLGPYDAQVALAARAPVVGLWWAHGLAHVWDALIGATIAYGQRPLQASYWLFALWLVGAMVFLSAWGHDAMKPNNPFILRSAEWIACAAPAGDTLRLEGEARDIPGLRAPGQSRLACFQATRRGAAYPDFNAGVYAMDVLFPLVQLEQQAAWVPDERAAHAVGLWAKGLVYLLVVAGWALSLLAVAGFSGLVKSD